MQDFVYGRDAEHEVFLDPGQYVILPRTNGIALKRPLSAEIEETKLLDDKNELTDIFQGTLEDIYYRFDTMISNAIEFEEFKDMLETVGETITKEDFDSKILTKYTQKDNGITLKGFKDWWKDQIREKSEADVWSWIDKLGYDRELYSKFSRSFIMTLHSDQEITLEVGDTVSTNLEQSA